MPFLTVLENVEAIPIEIWKFISKEIIEKIDFSKVTSNNLESIAHIVPIQ
ncbi:MAG: hypothetical protein ACK4HV_01840 [Parachlamydiaceae bacterium]